MSVILTNRQRLIRVAACAAVCGLSISFAIGEMVDEKGKLLRIQGEDPRLLPREYSLLQPATAAAELANIHHWQNALIAKNAEPLPALELNNVTDEIKTIHAKNESTEFPGTHKENNRVTKSIQKKIMSTGPSAKDVEAVRQSILRVTTELQDVNNNSLSQRYPVATTKATPKGLSITLRVPTDNTDNIEDLKTKGTPWELQGKVMGAGFAPGHFEVGVYSKIDQDGIPVGFPIVQQILPAGQRNYTLKVPPTVQKGYLFGEHVALRGGQRQWISPPINPIQRSSEANIFYADLFYKSPDVIRSISAVAEKNKISGRILTMFTPQGQTLPQMDVTIKIRGRREAARTDINGRFQLDVDQVGGTVFLEVLKAGYHPSVFAYQLERGGNVGDLYIASRDAISSVAVRLGIRQESQKGVFIGDAKTAEGGMIRGMMAALSLKSDGPYYFENGFPSREKKATGADGRFIFFNVEPGVGYLETAVAGEAIAPIGISLVEGGELSYKVLTPVSGKVRGRLFDPVTKKNVPTPLAGARVRIDGAAEWASTDAYGAFSLPTTKFIRDENVSIEVSSEKFNNHRYSIAWKKISRAEETNLFAFPAIYLSRLANSIDVILDPYSGITIGKVALGSSLRIDALSDHSVNNTAKDFYFDSKGKLRGSHNMTDPKFGTFIIFNVPKGNTLIQGNDSAGKMKFSDSVWSSSSTVSVLMN